MMIDYEQETFEAVATALRQAYTKIYITGDELTKAPPVFPAVVFRKSNSSINHRYSTFESEEVVVNETYYAEVYSNKENGKTAQCKEITSIINDVMSELRFQRAYEEQIFNADATIGRRVSKYNKSNVLMEE